MVLHCLFHRYWHTSVYRDTDESVKGKTNYCDTGREITASMTVDVQKLVIKEAVLRQYRGPGEIERDEQNISGLQGVEAYLGSGPKLRKGLKQVRDPLAASLFVETVRGVIQAESFLYEERGFSSPDEYSRYWEDMYSDSCRYYSNLDRISCSWSDYVGYSKREKDLFIRFKSQHLYKLEPYSYIITGNLSDSFHEISVCFKIGEQNRNVLSVESSFIRVPDNVCRESVNYLKNLLRKDLLGLSKKEIAELLGRSQGCIHLIDVVYDAAETLKLFLHE